MGRKCLSWEGGTRTFAFVAGGLLPAKVRGSINNQLMHVSDWYVTFCTLAGVDPADKWTDPATGLVHDVDGQNQWPSISTGKVSPRTLPTTHKSLLVDDGKGHMYKLINGNETRADRFHPNGSVYEDPYHECLPGSFNGAQQAPGLLSRVVLTASSAPIQVPTAFNSTVSMRWVKEEGVGG